MKAEWAGAGGGPGSNARGKARPGIAKGVVMTEATFNVLMLLMYPFQDTDITHPLPLNPDEFLALNDEAERRGMVVEDLLAGPGALAELDLTPEEYERVCFLFARYAELDKFKASEGFASGLVDVVFFHEDDYPAPLRERRRHYPASFTVVGNRELLGWQGPFYLSALSSGRAGEEKIDALQAACDRVDAALHLAPSDAGLAMGRVDRIARTGSNNVCLWTYSDDATALLDRRAREIAQSGLAAFVKPNLVGDARGTAFNFFARQNLWRNFVTAGNILILGDTSAPDLVSVVVKKSMQDADRPIWLDPGANKASYLRQLLGGYDLRDLDFSDVDLEAMLRAAQG